LGLASKIPHISIPPLLSASLPIHPTVRRASAKDYVTCRHVSIATEADPRPSAVFTGRRMAWGDRGVGDSMARGPNAACTGGNQLWSFGPLGKLAHPRSFGESRPRALAPNGK